jgi:GDSL-like Lipase/Acylhydrolase family
MTFRPTECAAKAGAKRVYPIIQPSSGPSFLLVTQGSFAGMLQNLGENPLGSSWVYGTGIEDRFVIQYNHPPTDGVDAFLITIGQPYSSTCERRWYGSNGLINYQVPCAKYSYTQRSLNTDSLITIGSVGDRFLAGYELATASVVRLGLDDGSRVVIGSRRCTYTICSPNVRMSGNGQIVVGAYGTSRPGGNGSNEMWALNVATGEIHSVATQSENNLIQTLSCDGSVAQGTAQGFGSFSWDTGFSLNACTGSPASNTPEYVALGDSYSSGYGSGNYQPGTFDPDPDKGLMNNCQRSLNSFAYEVARTQKMALKFKACQGAITNDLYMERTRNPYYNELGQLGSLSSETRLVTLTIGGNDLFFADVVKACANFEAFLGALCGANPVWDKVANVREVLDGSIVGNKNYPVYPYDKVFADIKLRAPNAKVVIVGYPVLFAPDGINETCRTVLRSDQRKIARETNVTNEMIRRHALKAGFLFADPSPLFKGHELCTNEPWFIDLIKSPCSSLNPLPCSNEKNGAAHPTPAGHAAMAQAVSEAIATASPTKINLTESQSASFTATVNPNQQRFSVNTSWPGSDVALTLVSPSGQRFTRTGGGGQNRTTAPTFEHVEIPTPEAGEWQIEVKGLQMAPEGEPVVVASSQEPIRPVSPPILRGVDVVSPTSLRVRWIDDSFNERGFLVYRVDASGSTLVPGCSLSTPGMTECIDTGVLPGGFYQYWVFSWNENGSSYSPTKSTYLLGHVPADAPNSPTVAFAVATGQHSVNVGWADHSTNESGFNVYRYVDGKYKLEATTGPNTTSTVFTDPTMDMSLDSQTIVISAINAAGETFADTYQVALRTLPTTPVVASPTYLDPTNVTSTTATIHWTDNASDEAGYLVYRVEGSTASLVNCPITTPGLQTCADTGLAPGTYYQYYVYAWNNSGTGYPGTAVIVHTPKPLSAPTILDATGTSSNSITIHWKDNASDETGYEVYEYVAGSYSLVASLPSDSSVATLELLSPGTIHVYVVAAKRGSEPLSYGSSGIWASTPAA